MDFELFRKVVDECAALGITHVRVHNYGEPFLDKELVEKVRYAKSKGIAEVGMISNGSLITEEIARGMIDAGLDAINISVDAAGKEVFESTRVHLKYDEVIGNIRTLARLRNESGRTHPKLILSFVRQNNSADEQAFIEEWTPDRRQDPHHRPAQLGRHAERPHRRAVPLLPAVADVHGALGRPGVHVLRRFRRPPHLRGPAGADDRRGLERPPLPRRPAPAPGVGRARNLPILRSAQERLAALDWTAHLETGELAN